MVDVQLPEGINRPQDRQYDSPDIGAGGASFLPPLFPFDVIARLGMLEVDVRRGIKRIRSTLTWASLM
jgi:hypothetical protein